MKATTVKQEGDFGPKLAITLSFGQALRALNGNEVPGITLNISEFEWQNFLDALPGTQAQKRHLAKVILDMLCDRINKPV